MFSTGRIKRPHRGLFFPSGTPIIDWDNPITAGLVGCYVVTAEGGALGIIRCLVTDNILTNTYLQSPGTTLASIKSGPIGMQALDNDSSGNGSGFGGPLPPGQQVQNYSVLWAGTIQGLGNNLTNGYPFFFGASYNNTGTTVSYTHLDVYKRQVLAAVPRVKRAAGAEVAVRVVVISR